jgi:hypothetical protein
LQFIIPYHFTAIIFSLSHGFHDIVYSFFHHTHVLHKIKTAMTIMSKIKYSIILSLHFSSILVQCHPQY